MPKNNKPVQHTSGSKPEDELKLEETQSEDVTELDEAQPEVKTADDIIHDESVATVSTEPSGGQETVEQLLARWEGYLQTDRDGYSHHIDNPKTLVGARYEILQDHVRDLKAALGK